MEAGHGKGPCDPIGGTAKRKADQAVKNGRFVIQDAVDFYEWSKQESSAIKYVYLSTEEYEISANFLKALRKNLDSVNGTMKLHAVFSLKPNWIWIRDTSCFCSNCFDHNFGKDSCCKGWHECELKTIVPRKTKNVKNVFSVSNAASTRSVVEEGQSSSNVTLVPTFEPPVGDYVGAVYDRKDSIGMVNDMDEDEAEMHFLSHNGRLNRQTKFKQPKETDDVSVSLSDILCIVPEPTATKRSSFEMWPEVLENWLKLY